MKETIRTIAEAIRAQTELVPEFGIVLGTGLSGIGSAIESGISIPYRDIPGFPVSTVQSHKGELILGWLDGTPVACLAGRFHYYEGYSMKELTLPIRVLAELGAKKVILSNAAGGTNPGFSAGEIVFVSDHINLMPENPLRGRNDDSIGPRFPDMSEAYDRELRKTGLAIAGNLGMEPREGVYVALSGPNLETPAEYRFVHRIGGDLVGMSTVPEVIVARHQGMRVLVMSVVTNICYPPEMVREVSVEEVIAMAGSAAPKMSAIVRGIVKQCRD